ncbi:hypothetical protein OIO90_005714 [Microbotryomycetes sp. JL221]|nr:hypothetical protein OIO90_005714 [Microbotryomycetes sp. JL221]
MALVSATASTAWQLWATPTISISLVIEAERREPSLVRLLSRFVLLWRPSLLRDTLDYELSSGRLSDHVISATTLRVVDAAYYRSLGSQLWPTWNHDQSDLRSTPIYPEELVVAISSAEGVESGTRAYDLLQLSIERVLATYNVVDKVVERIETAFDVKDTASQKQLRKLYETLRPGRELPQLVGKQWQDLGFQGTSPATDFRDLNSLALDALLYFAREYESRAIEVVDEAVGGGAHWYPLALALIHMTAYALELALSASPASSDSAAEKLTSIDGDQDISPFLRVTSELMLLFHAHWLRGNFTVMQFEQVSKQFQEVLTPYIRRGVLDGRALGWYNQELRIKQD